MFYVVSTFDDSVLRKLPTKLTIIRILGRCIFVRCILDLQFRWIDRVRVLSSMYLKLKFKLLTNSCFLTFRGFWITLVSQEYNKSANNVCLLIVTCPTTVEGMSIISFSCNSNQHQNVTLYIQTSGRFELQRRLFYQNVKNSQRPLKVSSVNYRNVPKSTAGQLTDYVKVRILRLVFTEGGACKNCHCK